MLKFAWLRNGEVLEERETHLKKRIKEAFDESRGTYGPDRIIAELRKKGERIGRKRCAKYMADMNLNFCRDRHRAKSLANSKKAGGDGSPNILRDQVAMDLLQQYGLGLRQRFSHVGMPDNNAWSESFFATMKKGLIHWTHYETKESVRAVVFEYILLLQCEKNPEATRLHVAEGIF